MLFSVVSSLRLPVQGVSHESLLGTETVLESQTSQTREGQDRWCGSAAEITGRRDVKCWITSLSALPDCGCRLNITVSAETPDLWVPILIMWLNMCVCVCVAACVQPGAEAEWDRKQESPWRRRQIWNSHTGNDSSPLLYDQVQHDSADLFKLRKPGVSGSEVV